MVPPARPEPAPPSEIPEALTRAAICPISQGQDAVRRHGAAARVARLARAAAQHLGARAGGQAAPAGASDRKPKPADLAPGVAGRECCQRGSFAAGVGLAAGKEATGGERAGRGVTGMGVRERGCGAQRGIPQRRAAGGYCRRGRKWGRWSADAQRTESSAQRRHGGGAADTARLHGGRRADAPVETQRKRSGHAADTERKRSGSAAETQWKRSGNGAGMRRRCGPRCGGWSCAARWAASTQSSRCLWRERRVSFPLILFILLQTPEDAGAA